jgi:predicted RNA-binding protein with PUA-like domain
MAKRCWLMKSEPESFGIDDLARVRIEPWTGVRNFQARNLMRDEMQVGDDVLFYHSNATPPGAAGLAVVHRTGVVDDTQFEPSSKYYDPKARRTEPVWICVDVSYVATFPRFVSLEEMHAEPRLADMLVLRRGMRLSVQPVSTEHFEIVKELASTPAPAVASGRANAGAKKPTAKGPAKKPIAKAAKAAAKKPAAAKPAKAAAKKKR